MLVRAVYGSNTGFRGGLQDTSLNDRILKPDHKEVHLSHPVYILQRHPILCVRCRLVKGLSELEGYDGYPEDSSSSCEIPKGIAEVMTTGQVTPEVTDRERNEAMRDRVYSAFTFSHPSRQQSQGHSAQPFEQCGDLPDEKVEIAESMEPSLTSGTSEQSSSTVADKVLAGGFGYTFYAAQLQDAKSELEASKHHQMWPLALLPNST